MDIPRLMQLAAVPGLSMAVVRDGALADVQAYGVRDVVSGDPVTPATIFQAASLTKPIVAYGALLLHQSGLLDLDRPLHSLLPHPDLADDPRAKRLTMRTVLSHTTGMPNWRSWEKDNVLRIHREPGAAFEYSGEGFVYLQRVMEHLTGLPLDKYVAERVLAPLGLADTALVWSDRFAGRIARTRDKQGHQEELWQPAEANAAYTAHTTPSDFASLMAALMRPGAGPLAASLVQEMFRPQVHVRGVVAWGLGWGLQVAPAEPAFWQWGDNGGTRNFAIGYPLRGHGIVIMTNGRRGLRICNRIIRGALGEFSPVFGDFLRPRYGRRAW